MASTTDLGKWMLTNGGEYNPETVYEQLTMVMYENSTYITLKTVQGITPTDDHVNYQLMAKGFNPTALASVQATDTSGVLGEAGGTVSAQDLVDWVVDQAANKLLKLTDLVSVQTNDATKGVSAALAYAMNQKIEQTNSNLAIVSSCISNVYIKKITNEGKYTQVFATSIIDSSHFCGLVIADGGLYSYHNIGNVTALVNRSTYKVVCSNAGNLARLSITGMGTWDECVVISNRDFKLTHE